MGVVVEVEDDGVPSLAELAASTTIAQASSPPWCAGVEPRSGVRREAITITVDYRSAWRTLVSA